jgi:hypothetical protein
MMCGSSFLILFYGVLSFAEFRTEYGRMIMNDEAGRMWEKAVLAHFANLKFA